RDNCRKRSRNTRKPPSWTATRLCSDSSRRSARKWVGAMKRLRFSPNCNNWHRDVTSPTTPSHLCTWLWAKKKRLSHGSNVLMNTVPAPISCLSSSSHCLIPCAAIHDLSVWSQRSLALRRASDRLNRQRVLNVIAASPIACRFVHHFPAYDRCFHFCIANGFRFEVKDVVTQDDHVSQFAWRD